MFHRQLRIDIPGTTTDFIDEFNGYFQAFPTVEAAKLDIFKRIDIYSFGILILSCINGYVSWKNTQPDKIIVPDIREFMLKMYKIAYDCCIQLDKCSNFNKIVDDYIDVIRPLISTILPGLDPSIIPPLLPPSPPPLLPPSPPSQSTINKSSCIILGGRRRQSKRSKSKRRHSHNKSKR